MSKGFTKYLLILFLFCISKTESIAAISEFETKYNSKARIVASFKDQTSKHKDFIAGFHIKMDKGWKIYGKFTNNNNPTFAIPPSFDFTNSKNINVSNFQIIWPTPKIVTEEILGEEITYPLYEKSVIIPVIFQVIDVQKPIIIKAKINYGLCKEICIPVEQKLEISIKTQEFDQEALNKINQFLEKKITKTANKQLNKKSLTLILAIIISFIGGLILNVMPCVLPVFSIKLLSIIDHAKSSIKKIRIAYLSTILGILFSFLVFAIIISSFKLAGNVIGWGAQFQNPYFLIFLVIILSLFTANLAGLFEINIGNFLANIVDKKIKKTKDDKSTSHTIITNFMSGILVVLLATPCSAPFVGTAISFAFTQDILTIFAILFFMGLGLAFPYIVLIVFPNCIKILPKPGIWMANIKNLMAGFLAATIIWLIYILSNNIGFVSSMLIALLCIFILISLKLCQKFQISKLKEIFILITLIIVIFIIPIKISKYFEVKQKTYDKLWIKFDRSKINQLVSEGKTVVIDITADWCITCKLNKALVLNSKAVREKLSKPNIIGMRGDLTRPDSVILDFMSCHNRYAIPFNIVYGPKAKNGILLSELLSKRKLLEIIEEAN